MYGDTSEPQLLQTTKRSGPLAMSPTHSTRRAGAARRLVGPGRGPAARGSAGRAPRRRGLRRRGVDDLAHDLGVVAVRLEHHALPVRPAAALDQVDHALELRLGPEVLRVLAQAV